MNRPYKEIFDEFKNLKSRLTETKYQLVGLEHEYRKNPIVCSDCMDDIEFEEWLKIFADNLVPICKKCVCKRLSAPRKEKPEAGEKSFWDKFHVKNNWL